MPTDLTQDSALELAMILIQISLAAQTKSALQGQTSFSVYNAKLYFVLFMPGVSAGLICFAVFGTTEIYGRYLCRLLFTEKIRRFVGRIAIQFQRK